MLFETQRDSESWRIDRLKTAVGHFEEIYGINHDQLSFLISGVSDHKGDLTINWYHPPTARQKNDFNIAWRIVGESTVHHEVVAQPQIDSRF